jgi:mRNA interferase MazF
MPSDAAEYSFGNIVLVPFPFTDQSASKQRPAVVISTASYNAGRPDIILMAVTSQLRASAAFGEVWLADWQDAGLLKPSAVKPVVATLEQLLIIRQLGAISIADATRLNEEISKIIGTAS